MEMTDSRGWKVPHSAASEPGQAAPASVSAATVRPAPVSVAPAAAAAANAPPVLRASPPPAAVASSSMLKLTDAPFTLSPAAAMGHAASTDTAPLRSDASASSSASPPPATAAVATPAATGTADVRVAISADLSTSSRPQLNQRQRTEAATGANGTAAAVSSSSAAPAPAKLAPHPAAASSVRPGSAGVMITQKTVSSLVPRWQIWVLHPDSHRYRWWLLIVVCCIVANTWSVPFRLSVGYKRILGEITGFTGTDIIFDLVYLANILVKSRLAFFQEGALITDPHVIWQTYKARPGGLLLDACCVLPLDWILFASGHFVQSVFLRLLRLGQLLVIARYIGDLENSPGVNVTLVRLGKITMFYLLLSHLTGCAWFSFALPDDFGPPDVIGWYPSSDMLEHAYLSQYLRVLYWGLATLSDRIEYPNPITASTTAFMVMTQIIGVLLLAYVIGNIAFAIDDANETFQRHRLQLDYVQRFMTHAKLPESMQTRVRKYYDHVWATNRGFDDFQMLKDLPASLRTDVCLQLTASTVGCNSLFQGLDPHFLSSLVKVLLQRTLVPDEILIREGEPGDEMFFLRAGKIVISVKIDAPDALSSGNGGGAISPSPGFASPSGTASPAAAAWKGPTSRTVQTCVDGDLIGEYCVLLGDQCPVRTSSATAVGYCDLFVLRQDDLASLLSFYPSVQEELETRTTRRRQLTLRKEENIIGLGRAGVAAAAGPNGLDSHRNGNGEGQAPSAAEAKDAKMKAKMAALLGGDSNANSSVDLHARPGSGGKQPPSVWRWRLLRLEHWSRKHWLVNSLWYENWTRLIALITLYNAICVPFRLAFVFDAVHPAMLFFDYFTDCFLIVNVAATMWLRQPPKVGNHALSVNSGAGIATRDTFESFGAARARYWKSGWMAWDIATSAPLDLFMLIQHEMNPWFRVGRVARLLTDIRVLSNANLQAAGMDGAAVGLVQLLMGFVLLTHWCSCAYWSFHYFLGLGEDTDHEETWLPKLSIAQQGLLASYLYAQFKTFVLLTGLGKKAPPISDAEVGFVVFMILLGILLVAWAIGEVGERIANLDRFSAEFNRTCLNTYSFMSYRHFDPRLQKRVRDYLAHWWSARHGVDPHVAMEGLPVGLRSEIMQHLCKEVLMKVPLLARLLNADPTFSLGRHLIERLRFDSYPAGELIFQEGEIGESMFFITEGEVGIIVPPPQPKKQLTNPPDRRGSAVLRQSTQTPAPVPRHLQPQYATPSKILGAGSFFGEVGILGNGLRTASIRALKPVFLLVLNRAALLEIMDAHEEFAVHIREISATRAAKLAYIKARGAEEAEREAIAAERRRSQMELEGTLHSIELTQQNSPRKPKGVHFDGPGLPEGSRSSRPSAGGGSPHLDGDHVGIEYGLEISRSQGDLHIHARHHDRQHHVDYLEQAAQEEDEQSDEEQHPQPDKDAATASARPVYGDRLQAPKGRWARDHSGSRTDDSDDDHHDQMVVTRTALADGATSAEVVMAPDADDAEAAVFRRVASGNSPNLSPLTTTPQSATTTDVALTIEGGGGAAAGSTFAVPPPLRIPSMPAEGVMQLESVRSQDEAAQTPSPAATAASANPDAHQSLSGAPSSGSGTAPIAFPASPRPSLQPGKGHTRRKSGAPGGGGSGFYNAGSTSTAPANRSLGGPTLQPRTSSITGPSGPPVLRGRDSSTMLDTPRGPPTDVLRRLERQTSFKQMRPDGDLDDADLTSGALSARSARGLSRRLESAPNMSASPRVLRTFSSQVGSVDSDALPGQDAMPTSPLLDGSGSIHTPSFARMTSSAGYSKSGHSSGPQMGSARPPLSGGPLSARGPLSPAMGGRPGLSNAAQFFARQSSIGTRSTGHVDPHDQRNPIAAATHSSALALAQATLLSSHDHLTGDDIPPPLSALTRIRSLEKRTMSSTAPPEVPLSVFAQARRLHAERTIEAAVRCGVVRSEAQLADVVTAVEAQLEEQELERREAHAAVEAGQDPSAHPPRPGAGGRSQRPTTMSPLRVPSGGGSHGVSVHHSRVGSLDVSPVPARLSVSKLASELAGTGADASPGTTPTLSPFVPAHPLYGEAPPPLYSAAPPHQQQQHHQPHHQPHLPHVQPVSVTSPPPAHPGEAQAAHMTIHLQTPTQMHNRRIALAEPSYAAAPARLHLAQGSNQSPDPSALPPVYSSRLAAPYVAPSTSSASSGAHIEGASPVKSEREGGRQPASSAAASAAGSGGWTSPPAVPAAASPPKAVSDRADSLQSPLLARVRGNRSANATFVPAVARGSSSAYSSPSSLTAAASGPVSLSPSPAASPPGASSPISPNTLAVRRPVAIHRSPAKAASPPGNHPA